MNENSPYFTYYKLGYKDFERGKTIDENPVKDSLLPSEAWEEGWNDARINSEYEDIHPSQR